MDSVPALVFFNACESGRLRATVNPLRQLDRSVGFAEAFLRGGVANFIGTWWPVSDSAAAAFAATLYRELAKGESIGDALQHVARLAEVRLSPRVGQRHQHLSVRTLRPIDPRQCSPDGPSRPFNAASQGSSVEPLDHVAARIQKVDRVRNSEPFLEHALEVRALHALAAHHSANVGEDAVEVMNLRVFVQEGFQFLRRHGVIFCSRIFVNVH
jgi:uncharacterized protein (DUF58 family)